MVTSPFFPHLWNFLHNLPDGNAFDFDTLLAKKLFHHLFLRVGYGGDPDSASDHLPFPDRNLFLMERNDYMVQWILVIFGFEFHNAFCLQHASGLGLNRWHNAAPLRS